MLTGSRLWPGAACLHLDIGAGTGANVDFAREYGFRSVALEYDPDYAHNIVAPAVRGAAGHLPFQAETFDLVTIIHVLEHLPRHRWALSEIRRVLKAGGSLIIEVPGKYSLQELLNYVYARAALQAKDRHLAHCNYYTYSSLRRMLEDSGFVIDDERTWGGLLSGTATSSVDVLLRIII